MEGVRFIPCKICSAPSTGFHFGALTCEACKAFFRRVLKSGATLQTLTCSGTDPSPIDPLAAPQESAGDNSNDNDNLDQSAASNGDGAALQNNNDGNADPSSQPQQQQQQGHVQSRRCDLAFSPKKCPRCRYQRCLEVGMGPSASKIGRPTKGRVAEVREELHRIKPWLDFKQGNSLNKLKEDGFSSSNGDLASSEPRSASLLMLASKESRKRTAIYGDTSSKKRHPSMPSSVYYGGAAGSQSSTTAAYASHVRHFSGDVIDSKYRPYFGMNEMDFDDADEDDDMNDEEEAEFYAQQSKLQKQQQQSLPQTEPLNLLRTNPNAPVPQVSAAVKSEQIEPATISSSAAQQSLLAGLSMSGQPPATAILTVIQHYNNSGGNRQRFVQALREAGADREGSNLAWLYHSADQWFDIATVMFQSPLAISNLLSSASAVTTTTAPPPPPSIAALSAAMTMPESDPLKILSQFAVASMPTAQPPQQQAPPPPPQHQHAPAMPPTSIPLPMSLSTNNNNNNNNNGNNSTASPLLASSAFSPWTQALRSETMARQVVQATKHLASLNLSRQGMRPGALNISAPDLWGFLMQNFEVNTTHIINFARSIPGYAMITSVSDRAILSMNSFFPLLFANMSIEFDPVSENIRLYWMNGSDVDDGLSCARSILKTPQEAATENGSTMKTTNLTVVEFGFMCALVHFNPAIRGLQDPISVEMVASELLSSVEYFINTNFPSSNSASSAAVRVAFPAAFLPTASNGPTTSLAASRIAELQRLVTYFRNLNATSNWISNEMSTGVHQQVMQTAAAAAINSAAPLTQQQQISVSTAAMNNRPAATSNGDQQQQNDDTITREIYRKMFEMIALSPGHHHQQQQAAVDAAQAQHFSGVSHNITTSPTTANTPFLQQFLPRLGNNSNSETERILCPSGISSSQAGPFQRQ